MDTWKWVWSLVPPTTHLHPAQQVLSVTLAYEEALRETVETMEARPWLLPKEEEGCR
jgi:hypothetical protein